MYDLCFMIMVVVNVPFLFDIEKIQIEKERLSTKLKILQNDIPLNGVSTVFSNTIKHMFDA